MSSWVKLKDSSRENNCPIIHLTGGVDSADLSPVCSYLQTGNCGDDGEGCTLVEATLINGASSADISLIPPYALRCITASARTDALAVTHSASPVASATTMDATVPVLIVRIFLRLAAEYT